MSPVHSGIEHQERDLAFLEDLFVSRVMTLSHAAALHFGGRREAAKKRVQKLKAAGLVRERPRKARDPGVLFLTRAGYLLAQSRGRLDPYPLLSTAALDRRSRVSELTLRHELEVMDVKAALLPAINKAPGFAVLEFSTWPLLHEFEVRMRTGKVRVKPDGFVRVEEKVSDDEVYQHTFFLEVDRGTETLDTLTDKAVAYREYYARGGYAESVGAPRGSFAEHPFRVLMVLPSEERRNNMAERLLALNPPVETQVWVAVSSALQSNPLGSVWLRPREYREAVKSMRRPVENGRAYRRQAGRDSALRGALKLKTLFSE